MSVIIESLRGLKRPLQNGYSIDCLTLQLPWWILYIVCLLFTSRTFSTLFRMTIVYYTDRGNSTGHPKTTKHQSFMNYYWLYFGRQKFVLNSLNGAAKGNYFWSGLMQLQKKYVTSSTCFIWGAVSESWAGWSREVFIGSHNRVVSIIMKIYSKLAKVQVEPGTLRIRIRNWAFQDPTCRVMPPEDAY